MIPSNLVELMLDGDRHGPNLCVAYVPGGGSDVEAEISHAQFVDRARRVAAGMQRVGVRSGTHVAFVASPRVDYMVSMAAALIAGAVLVPVNHLFKRRELDAYLRMSDAHVVVVDRETAPLVSDVAADIAAIDGVISLDEIDGVDVTIADLARDDPAVPATPDRTDLAVLMHTSGTTGLPKIVPRTHGTFTDFALLWARHYMRPTDRLFSFMPMYHQAGFLTQWLPAYSLGVPFFQMERFSPGPFWETVRRYQLTNGLFMPPVPNYLLLAPETPAEHSLQWGFGSAASDQWLAFQERFGIPLHGGYGSTETTIVGMTGSRDDPPCPPEMFELPLGGSVMGELVPDWCQARIADERGQECPPLGIGECQFTGPGVFEGYYHDPKATAEAFTPDGWFRSGDLGYRTADGRLIMIDRAKNLIRRSGENIAPAEIEAVLLEHPDIAEAAVVPMPDEHRGQEILACIVRSPGSTLTAADVYALCERELAVFKVPRYVDFRDELPYTPTMKVRRDELIATVDPTTWEDRQRTAKTSSK